jgi:hypothetical protein
MFVLCRLHGKRCLCLFNSALLYLQAFGHSYCSFPFNRIQISYKCMCIYLVGHCSYVWEKKSLLFRLSLKDIFKVKFKLFVNLENTSAHIIIIHVLCYWEPEHIHWYLELMMQSSIFCHDIFIFIYHFNVSNTFMYLFSTLLLS